LGQALGSPREEWARKKIGGFSNHDRRGVGDAGKGEVKACLKKAGGWGKLQLKGL